VTNTHHYAQLLLLEMGLTNSLWWLALNCHPPDLGPQVARIT
jgi:hypothetical protein